MPALAPIFRPFNQTWQAWSTPSNTSVSRLPASLAGSVKSLRYHQSLRATSYRSGLISPYQSGGKRCAASRSAWMLPGTEAGNQSAPVGGVKEPLFLAGAGRVGADPPIVPVERKHRVRRPHSAGRDEHRGDKDQRRDRCGKECTRRRAACSHSSHGSSLLAEMRHFAPLLLPRRGNSDRRGRGVSLGWPQSPNRQTETFAPFERPVAPDCLAAVSWSGLQF